MVSSNCNRSMRESFKFKANRPHFFKIILQETIDNGNLDLPLKFCRKYGTNMSDQVILETAAGAKWKVELVKCDGRFRLQNGWKEFAKYYTLSHGSFLVFEYKKHCYFHVIIFDKSATEIDYPFDISNCCNDKTNSKGKFQEMRKGDTGENVSVEILKHISGCLKRKEKSPLPLDDETNYSRKFQVNVTEETANVVSVETLEDMTGCPKRKEKSPFSWDHETNCCCESQENVKEETADGISMEILEDMSGCRKRKLKSPFESPGYNKTSRTSFRKCNSSVLSDDAVELKEDNSNRKGYPHCYSIHFEASRRDRDMSNQKRSSNRIINNMQPLTTAEKNKALLRANAAFRSENPFFMVIMQPTYVHKSKLSVPYKFAKAYFKRHDHVILATFDERTWRVGCRVHHTHGIAEFDCSWKKFARDNGLEVGDVCVFELVEMNEISLRVVIFRTNEDAVFSRSCSLPRGANKVKPVGRLAAKIESEIDRKDATEISSHFNGEIGKAMLQESVDRKVTQGFAVSKRFISENPFFTFVVRSWHLVHQSVIADRSWPVKLITYSNLKPARLCGGWAAFARGNSLQEGDVCVFEMISSSLVNVTISRSGFTNQMDVFRGLM